jgi:hypothetical protein
VQLSPWGTATLTHCTAHQLKKLNGPPLPNNHPPRPPDCRAIRSQRFLEFTAQEITTHEAKMEAQWQDIEERRRGKVRACSSAQSRPQRQAPHCGPLPRQARD